MSFVPPPKRRRRSVGLVLLLSGLLACVHPTPTLAQGPWTTPPSSNGKVRIASTASDALCVGGTGATPASCTGGAQAGTLTLSGGGVNVFTGSTNGTNGLQLANASTGTASVMELLASAGSTSWFVDVFSQNYTTSGTAIQGSARMIANGAGGLNFVANNAAGTLGFYTGGLTHRGTMHASGGFSWGDATDPGATNLRVAGTITAVGGVTGTATNATNVGVTNDNATSGFVYPMWSGASSGFNAPKVSATGLYFNPSTGQLFANTMQAATFYSTNGRVQSSGNAVQLYASANAHVAVDVVTNTTTLTNSDGGSNTTTAVFAPTGTTFSGTTTVGTSGGARYDISPALFRSWGAGGTSTSIASTHVGGGSPHSDLTLSTSGATLALNADTTAVFGGGLVDITGTAASGTTTNLRAAGWDVLGYASSEMKLGGFRTSQWTSLGFYVGGTRYAQINTSGILEVGTQAAPKNGIVAWSDPNSKIALTLGASSNVGGGVFAYFRNASETAQGSITATNSTTTAYNTTSDARMKQDLGVVTFTDRLRDLRVHDFIWTPNGVQDRGVFAQEVYGVMPNVVTVGGDRMDANGMPVNPWSVDYSKFVADLIVGWQSHDARIATLERELNTMQALLRARTTNGGRQ